MESRIKYISKFQITNYVLTMVNILYCLKNDVRSNPKQALRVLADFFYPISSAPLLHFPHLVVNHIFCCCV